MATKGPGSDAGAFYMLCAEGYGMARPPPRLQKHGFKSRRARQQNQLGLPDDCLNTVPAGAEPCAEDLERLRKYRRAVAPPAPSDFYTPFQKFLDHEDTNM